MKKIMFLTFIAMAAATAPTLMANTVEIYQNAYSAPGGPGAPSGGELVAITGTPVDGAYSPLALNGGGFVTFCMETDVDVYPGAVNGFTLGQVTQDPVVPLTAGVAYLYALFATGNLNYDYANAGAGPGGTDRIQDAGLLQAAIWWFQGNQTWSGDPFNPVTNPYYNLALSTLGAGALAPSGGAFGVNVMELTYNGNPAQDQLIYGIPDGGSTLLMLGMGFSMLALAGLRGRKSVA